jgi:hypothetical protein
MQHVILFCSACLCSYWTLAEPYTLETEIKKSQFIATAWPVTSAAEVSIHCLQALSHIAEALHPTISHNWGTLKSAGIASVYHSANARTPEAAVSASDVCLQALSYIADASDPSASHNC